MTLYRFNKFLVFALLWISATIAAVSILLATGQTSDQATIPGLLFYAHMFFIEGWIGIYILNARLISVLMRGLVWLIVVLTGTVVITEMARLVGFTFMLNLKSVLVTTTLVMFGGWLNMIFSWAVKKE